MRLDDPSCVLLLTRTLFGEHELPVEASMMTMVAKGAHRYELRYHQTVPTE